MEKATKLVASLPPDLHEYFLNKIIQILFSKAELIRFLLLNSNYCKFISIHDLILTITNKYLKFDDDIISNDIINLGDIIFEDLNSFENLFKNHILSIKKLILKSNIDELNFLLKYSKEIQCDSLNSFSILLNNKLDINKLKIINLSFYKNQFNQFQNFIKNLINLLNFENLNIQYNINFIIYDHYDFKEMINIIHYLKTKFNNKFKFKFNILFILTIPISENELNYPISKLIKHFSYCLNILKNYKIYKNNIKVILKLNLTNSNLLFNNNFLEISEFIGFNLINKLIIESLNDNYYNFNFFKINKFQNLKLIEIKADQQCNFQNFGNLSNLKYLKKIIFYNNNIDFNWLSNCLPNNIETIKLFQSSNDIKTKKKNLNYNSIFKIPKNLKNLIIESDDSNTIIDFEKFKFNNDINLKKIIIINYFIKKSIIKIINLKSLPKSLKEFRFHDSNDFTCSLNENCFLFDVNFDNSSIFGVYSNIDVEFTSKCKCFCNYSLKFLNLKSKRICNIKK